MSEKPTTVVEAGGLVFRALRTFVEMVTEESLSKYHMIPLAAVPEVLPKKAVVATKPPATVAKPAVSVQKKRPIEEEQEPEQEEAPVKVPEVAKKPKIVFEAHPECNGNVVADPPRPCRGGAHSNVLVEYDDQAVCKTCRSSITRTLAALKKATAE